MMILIQSLLNRIFTGMAVGGLLLAGWGLIVTPEEIQGGIRRDSGWARWSAQKTSQKTFMIAATTEAESVHDSDRDAISWFE